MKLLCLIPASFAVFFIGTSAMLIKVMVHPIYPDERLVAFGVFLIQGVSLLVCIIAVVLIAVKSPWGLPKGW
jgi:intracellular septation protein A